MLQITKTENLRKKLKQLVVKVLKGNIVVVIFLNREIDKASDETLEKLRKELLDLLL